MSAPTPPDSPARDKAIEQRKQQLRATYPLQRYVPCRWTVAEGQKSIEEGDADSATEYESILREAAEQPESTLRLTELALASVRGNRDDHSDYLREHDLPHLRCMDDMCPACESEMKREELAAKRD